MNTNKIIQSLAYLASKENDLTLDNMKAYKLLWLADRLHLRMHGRTITGDCYYAMPYGPVPSDAKHILEHKPTYLTNDVEYQSRYIVASGEHRYKVICEPDLRELSISDKKVLDKVVEAYGGMTPLQLSNMSHSYPEWLPYKDKIKNPQKNSSYPIDMLLFFEEGGEDKRHLFEDEPAAVELSKEVYMSHHCA